MSIWKHVRAIGMFPFMATVVIPTVLVWLVGFRSVDLPVSLSVTSRMIGVVLVMYGLFMLGWTVSLFDRVGRGTLSPIDATRKLVVRGPYAYVRNPMYTGVFGILLGESALALSPVLAIWFVAFVAIVSVFYLGFEEPGLRRRFGAEFEEYRRNVGKWIPRLRPWHPTAGQR